MDYREITKRISEYQKKLLGEYQSRLGALPPGRLKRKLRGNEAEYCHVLRQGDLHKPQQQKTY